jgi:cytochrome c oxidase assembly protein subunit 11
VDIAIARALSHLYNTTQGGLGRQVLSANRQTVIKLAVISTAMFIAVFTIMPPLYNLLCEVTGLRKTEGAYKAEEIKVDRSREVTVRFVATHNDAMPWDFYPLEFKVKVNPGEKKVVQYYARNNTDRAMIAQAVPSISPFNAVNYFHKIECFCFNHQPLAPGESAELGLQFVIDQDLPEKVTTITLSYTLFDITDQAQTSVATLR